MKIAAWNARLWDKALWQGFAAPGASLQTESCPLREFRSATNAASSRPLQLPACPTRSACALVAPASKLVLEAERSRRQPAHDLQLHKGWGGRRGGTRDQLLLLMQVGVRRQVASYTLQQRSAQAQVTIVGPWFARSFSSNSCWRRASSCRPPHLRRHLLAVLVRHVGQARARVHHELLAVCTWVGSRERGSGSNAMSTRASSWAGRPEPAPTMSCLPSAAQEPRWGEQGRTGKVERRRGGRSSPARGPSRPATLGAGSEGQPTPRQRERGPAYA